MKRLLVSLVLFVFASSVGAAELGKRGKKEYMGACSRQNPAELYSITNGSNAESCSDEQTTGAVTILCQCLSDDGETFMWTKVGGGAAPDLSAYALLAGDADGQTIQGRTGANKARIEIGEDLAPNGVYIWGATSPGHASAPSVLVDDGYFSAQSEDTNTNFSITNGALVGISDNSLTFSVNPTGGYFAATPTNFYAGSPSSATSIDLSDSAFRVTYGQTPPTNANDACTAGDTIDTATFHYYCAATDTWVRVAMATW